MSDLPLTGGCGCGAVRFELTEPPVTALYCHCTRCQRRTGTASSAQMRVKPGSVRLLEGEELVRAWEPEGGAPKAFCSACGSALFSYAPGTADIGGGRPGGVRGRAGQTPAARPH